MLRAIRRHPWRSLGLTLAIALLLYFAGAGYLMSRFAAGLLTVGPLAEMLDREPRPEDPLALGFRGDPGAALGLDFETVEIATELGMAEAWHVTAGGDGGLAAIYVHGIAGAREDGYRHLSMLNAAGIPVLLIQYRNDPGAPADPSGLYGFGLTEWRDLEVAVAEMQARGHDRLLVVAESMGGAILGQFLARSDRAGAVVAVALDSPAVALPGVLRHFAEEAGLPLPGAVGQVGLTILDWRTPIDYRAAQVDEIYAAFSGPLFVAHGIGDRIVPAATTDAMLAARQGTSVVHRTEADHLLSFGAGPDAYRAAFDAFLGLIPQ